MVILYPEEDQVRRGIVHQNKGVWWSTVGSLDKEKNLREKRGRFFPFKFNCPFTPSVVILYPEEDQVRRGIVHQNRGVWWSTVGRYFKRR